jgi:hypothetical protein
MILPDAIDDAPPGQGITRICNPAGKRGATFAFRRIFRKSKPRRLKRKHAQRPRSNLSARMGHLPTGEHINRAGFPAVCANAAKIASSVIDSSGVDDFRFRITRQFFVELLEFGVDRLTLSSRWRLYCRFD